MKWVNYMFIGLLLVGSVAAVSISKYTELDDVIIDGVLMVLGEARFENSVLFNDVVIFDEYDSRVYVGNDEAFTGFCPRSYDLEIKKGIVVGCVGDS